MAVLKKMKPGHRARRTKEQIDVTADLFNAMVDQVNDLIDGAIPATDIDASGTISVDTIAEHTAATGVTIDSVLLKDGTVKTGAGAVGAVAVKINAENDGFYAVSASQLGASVNGTLVGGYDTNGVFTGNIAEQVVGAGVTVDGALIKDGSFIGNQATATATADGLTTGLLTGTDQFVTVTSANADHIVALPSDAACPIGTVIRGWVGANGFELRSDAADLTATMNNVTMGTTSEAAIPATTYFKVTKVASLTWILTALDELGAAVVIVPDAV